MCHQSLAVYWLITPRQGLIFQEIAIMQNLNQNARLGRVNKKPLLLTLLIALLVLLLGMYVSYQRTAPDSKSPQQSADAPTGGLQLGKNMVDHLESMAHSVMPESAPTKDEHYFLNDLEHYQQHYEAPKSLEIAPNNTALPPSPPSAIEQAAAMLKKQRASALLQALQASSSIDHKSTSALIKGQASSNAPESVTFSAQEQRSLDNAYHKLAALQGSNNKQSSPPHAHYLSAYQQLSNSDTVSAAQLQAPASSYVINQGAVIPCVLLTGINSDLPGLVQAQVSENVYDSTVGQSILIPKGSKVIGQYASAPLMGQERLMLAFNRLIYPDGSSLNLEAMPGSSHDGYAGFNAQVDNHFWSLLSNAVLLGGVSAGIALSVDDRNDEGELTLNGALSQSMGQSLGRVMTQIIERNLNTSPTLKVQPGFAFNVTLVKDLHFSAPYSA